MPKNITQRTEETESEADDLEQRAKCIKFSSCGHPAPVRFERAAEDGGTLENGGALKIGGGHQGFLPPPCSCNHLV